MWNILVGRQVLPVASSEFSWKFSLKLRALSSNTAAKGLGIVWRQYSMVYQAALQGGHEGE
jgi:hypothetical protein